MTLRTLAWRALTATPLIAAAVGVGLFAARELGELLPDPIAMGLSMFPAGFVAGLYSRGKKPPSSRDE